MLKRIFADLERKMHEHAIDSIDRPYSTDIAFEAGRRQGIHHGLRMARQVILDAIKGEDDDTGSNQGAPVRRLG